MPTNFSLIMLRILEITFLSLVRAQTTTGLLEQLQKMGFTEWFTVWVRLEGNP